MFFDLPIYLITLENATVCLKACFSGGEQNTIAEVFLDATDNRLTLKSVQEDRITDQAMRCLAEYLSEHFGGKQIFILPEASSPKFREKLFINGFSSHPGEIQRRQLCVSSLLKFLKAPSEAIPDGYSFSDDRKKIERIDLANLLSLVEKSGFSKAKMKQYRQQGVEALQLMCNYSKPFALINRSTGEMVAFCRATPLNEGNFYVGDTLVDERALGMNKAQVTAILYRNLARCILAEQGQKNSAIYLIAPQERRIEFEENYGCEPAKNTYVKFSPPQPGLQTLFESEIKKLQSRVRSPRVY